MLNESSTSKRNSVPIQISRTFNVTRLVKMCVSNVNNHYRVRQLAPSIISSWCSVNPVKQPIGRPTEPINTTKPVGELVCALRGTSDITEVHWSHPVT